MAALLSLGGHAGSSDGSPNIQLSTWVPEVELGSCGLHGLHFIPTESPPWLLARLLAFELTHLFVCEFMGTWV